MCSAQIGVSDSTGQTDREYAIWLAGDEVSVEAVGYVRLMSPGRRLDWSAWLQLLWDCEDAVQVTALRESRIAARMPARTGDPPVP